MRNLGNWYAFKCGDIWVVEGSDIYGEVMARLRFISDEEAFKFIWEQGN